MRKIYIITPLLLFCFNFSIGQANEGRKVDSLLNLSLEELMNIEVITPSGYMQTTLKAPSTITVVTAKQIERRGYEQLEDVLRDIPGIDMIHINGYSPTLFYFRGMYGAENLRVLLMIDGIVENNILGSNDLAGPAYSLHNVDRIEIIQGPVSALYGANAFGGVINIISKKGAQIDGFHAEQGFGTFNTSFEKISLGARKSNIEFSVAGSLYSSNGPVFSNRDPEYSGSYVDKAYSLNAMLSYYAKKSKTTIGYRTFRTPMGWGTYSNSPTTYLGLPAQGNMNSGVLGIVQRDIRGEKSGLDDAFLRTLFIQHDLTGIDKLSITARAVYRETGTAEDSYVYVTTNGTKLIRVPIASFSSRIQGEVSANYSLSQTHKFSGGIQYYRDDVEAGARKSTIDLNTIYLIDGRDTVVNIHATFLPRVSDTRSNLGGYLQYILHTDLLGTTDLTLGLRYDHNSYFGDAVSPRVALVNQPSNKLTFKLQFGNAFRAPTNLEIYQTPGRNFQLKKEKIRTYELNAIYTPSKNVRMQVNGFRNELSDVILLSNLSGLTPNKNPGMFTITGGEALLDVTFARSATAFLNFSYQDANGENLITKVSGDLPGVAKVKGNAGVTYSVKDLFSIHFSENWIGKRKSPRTSPYGPVKGYFLTNLAIRTGNFFNGKVNAALEVHNLLNTRWLDPGFRTADGFLYATVLEQPGINGLFKVSVEL